MNSFPQSRFSRTVKQGFNALVVAGFIGLSAQYAGAAIWMGMDPNNDLNDPSNWSPYGAPGNSEPVVFDGSGDTSNLFYENNFQGASTGVGNVTLTSSQTEDVIINALTHNGVFRLEGNAGITIESGAGSLGMGISGPNTLLLNLGGSAGTAHFTNNSTNLATFGPFFTLNRGGSAPRAEVVFEGTGNWLVSGQINNTIQGVHKDGTGNLTVSKRFTTELTHFEEGTVNLSNGFTATVGTKVGVTGKTATVTVDGGTVVIGSGANTDYLHVGIKEVATPSTATFGTFDLSKASSVNIDVGMLSLSRLESFPTAGGNVTGKLILSETGTNTIRARTFQLGHIEGGTIVTAKGELELGKTNTLYVDTWTVGGYKGIGNVKIASGGTLTLSGNINTATNLMIGGNLSSATSTNPELSVLDLTGGTFNATIAQLTIGAYSASTSGTGSGKGALVFDAGTVTVNKITMAQSIGANPQNTTGTLTMRGGSLTVANGIEDGGGVSSFQMLGGTANVSNGLSVDSMRVGGAAEFKLLSGAVRIGNGGANDILEIGGREASTPAPATATLDLRAASSVNINVGQLDTSFWRGSITSNPSTMSHFYLSTSGANTITADTIRLSQIDGGATGTNNTTLYLGANNVIHADHLYVGKDKSAGSIVFAAGGTLQLDGKTGAAANMYVGFNEAKGTATQPAESHVNFTGGTVNAALDQWVIGSYSVIASGASNNGGGRGKVTFGSGLITVNDIRLAETVSLEPIKTFGTFVLNGGELRAQRITRGLGNASFQFNGGTLKTAQFGSASESFNLANTGTGTLAHGVNTTIGSTLIYGNYTQGATAGIVFDLSLTQGNDQMTVFGDIVLGGTLTLNPIAGGTTLVDSFTLIHNEGSNPLTGSFLGMNEGQSVFLDFGTVSGTYYLSYMGGSSGRDLVLAMVPEPSRWLLALGGLTCLGLRRKRV